MYPAIDLIPEGECPRPRGGPGPGALLSPDQTPFPLRALEVRGRLTGPAASVEVTQRFANPFPEPVEAVYVFPLPRGAVVHRFRLRAGDRVVEGEVQERRQARRTYAEGIRAGHRSALLEQERDNLFTLQLGNLPPGEEAEIEFAYAERLEFTEGEGEFRFPLVVAPRYIPGRPLEGSPVGEGTEPDTDRVPDASRLTPPRLAPGLHTGASLSLEVAIETGGAPLVRLQCSQHAVCQEAEGEVARLRLARTDELLDRDFVLRFRLGGEGEQALLLSDGRHFLLSVLPPAAAEAPATPRDVGFVLDRSGSMGGAKMESARRAACLFLDTLGAHDRFFLLAFDDRLEAFRGGGWRPAREVPEARRWLQGIEARGGTEIAAPLQQALGQRGEEGRTVSVVVITDGQVGNEPEIYRMVARRAEKVRLFTFGVDTAVNDAFLRRLAELGRGTCELVTPGEALETALDRLARETGSPLVTDLEVRDRGLGIEPGSLVPARCPDLFASRAVYLAGRHNGRGALELEGRRADSEEVWRARVEPAPSRNPALGLLWARQKVQATEDRLRLEPGAEGLEEEILEVALEYGILTRFTAFVLVDRSEVVAEGGEPRILVQPVEMPARWEADALFSPPASARSAVSFQMYMSPAPSPDGLADAEIFGRGYSEPLRCLGLAPRRRRDRLTLAAWWKGRSPDPELARLRDALQDLLEGDEPDRAELAGRLEALLQGLEEDPDTPEELLREGRRVLRLLRADDDRALQALRRWLGPRDRRDSAWWRDWV